jgi:hypothetical protein
MRHPRLFFAALVLLGCGAEGRGPTSTGATLAHEDERTVEPVVEPGDSVGATRAEREAARTRPVEPAAAHEESPTMRLSILAPGPAEDGSGRTVQSARPVAIDLDAHRFPPRALDPVLSIGQLRLRHYQHPEPGVLRFVLSDAALLTEGAAVSVEYEGDAASRVVLTDALDAATLGEVTP